MDPYARKAIGIVLRLARPFPRGSRPGVAIASFGARKEHGRSAAAGQGPRSPSSCCTTGISIGKGAGTRWSCLLAYRLELVPTCLFRLKK